jgi:hypothetical protein
MKSLPLSHNREATIPWSYCGYHRVKLYSFSDNLVIVDTVKSNAHDQWYHEVIVDTGQSLQCHWYRDTTGSKTTQCRWYCEFFVGITAMSLIKWSYCWHRRVKLRVIHDNVSTVTVDTAEKILTLYNSLQMFLTGTITPNSTFDELQYVNSRWLRRSMSRMKFWLRCVINIK